MTHFATRPKIAWQYRSLASTAWNQLQEQTKLGTDHPAKCLLGDTGRVLYGTNARNRGQSHSKTDSLERQIDDTPEEKMARLRAVLFLAKEPLSSRKLSQYSNLADGTEARTLVTQLNRELDANSRAFRIEQVAGGFQLVTRPQFAKWLRRLEHVPGNIRLSAPAMETLAVVAYRQPVLRADVEAVRGVGCGEMLSQLLDRDLVRISGRSTELGRPYLYSTTKRFLMIFGLRSLEELPRAELFHETDLEDDEVRDVIASDSQQDDHEDVEASSEGISEEN